MKISLYKKGLFIFLFLFSVIKIFAQKDQLIFTNLTVDQGLSQNQVFCIYRDYTGLLWFGTQDGLNLFDGSNFKVFRHQPGNINSLPDYAVNTICETDTGIFWIGTREGMSKFDFRKGIFTHFKHNPDSSNSLVDNNIWMIIKDSENHLWISTRNGLSRFNAANNTFTNFKSGNFNSISNNFVFALAEDNNKNIWIGGRGGVDRYDLREGKFYNYKTNPEKPEDVSLNGITSLFVKNGTLWAGSYSGLYSLQINNISDQRIKFRKHLDFQTGKSTVRAIFQSDDKTVWVGTTGEGLIRYYPDSGKWNKYRKSVNAGSISEDYIISLLEDDHGVLWVGTYSSGINKYNRSSERFKTFTVLDPEQNINSSISSVFVDANKNLWVGTIEGKIVEIKNHLSENYLLKFHKTEKHLNSFFATTEIKKITQDKEGRIWAATFGNGIYRIDPITGETTLFKRETNNTNSLSNDFVHSLYVSSDGNIWIGTGAGGLNKYNHKNGTFTKYFFDPNNPKSISSDEVSSVCEDSQGSIWAGTTTKGLNRLNPATNEFDTFFHDVNETNSISSNRIICLYVDKKSNLWIGTFGGGLNRWKPETNSFEHFTNKDGLPSNIINSIVEDQFGNLWISTDKGISLFRVDERSFKNYDLYDGLQGNEFIQSSGFSNEADGKIYFGGVNGLNIFDPIKLYEKSKPANLTLTDFKIFNKSVIPGEDSPLKTNILYAKEIRLSHDQNFFTIEFASLDFNNPDKTQYAYKLEGFNKEWISAGNQRYATYTNLDPGEYIFRVKATNNDGTWNEEGVLLKVIMLPPWWQTWWAYILYTIFIVSILYSFRQYEMKRVKLRNELQLKEFESKKLQEVDQLKSHFFANISHEFRTPLTLILGLLQKFEGKTSDKNDLEDYGVMKRNAVLLLQLINQLLELSKIESGKAKLAASENDIVGFVKRIFASFASYAEQKNIGLLFNNKNLNDDSAEKINLFFDKDKMEKIISNLVSNAVKYTPDGNEIEVKITTQNDFVIIKVINTGVTISQADINHLFDRYYKVHSAESGLFEGTGLGLALVKELVELHQGKINVSSEYDVTEFVVSFPLGKDHLSPDEVSEPAKEEKRVLEFNELEKIEVPDQNILTSKDLELKSEKDIILVVEDHNDLRKYIKDSLSENFTVIESSNGKDGLENAIDKIPDLIISDVMMPEMDGYTFCKKIKSNEKTNHIPVILLTAKASTKDKLEGLELGADDYLIKPFNPEELKLRVRNLIKTREELRKKFTSEMVLKPAEVIVPSSQVQFMERIKIIIEANMENEKFGVDQLSDEAGMSRSQLHRKLKAITNQSTTEFIRNFRLQRAAQLILQDAGSMSEISYKVGFNSQAYFNKSFQELFGCSPSQYKKDSKGNL